jgi:DNA invertase Pin-like site-specific DNA recombinase
MSNESIRFAALIRVSTERQAAQGESLRTQDTQIASAVESLGGVITKRYAGQEHATASWERKQVEQLLRDASKKRKPFDAVIVADPSRWSRDNVASETGLGRLRDNHIRFFVLAQAYDLFDPTARLYLSLSTTINSYQAQLQKQKSLLNRINRAKRGVPTCGKLPFGRTFDRQTDQWGIVAEKKAMIDDVAKRYLVGEPLPQLAKEYGVNHSSLHKTLTQRCGDKWEIRFDADDLNIHQTVELIIPRLLSDKTIKAIKRKAEANRTYDHGKYRESGGANPYLLSGKVFCDKRGYTMFGQTNHNGHRYYRHAHTDRAEKCPLRPRPWVRCDELEDKVLSVLFETFGNPKAAKRAFENATPNREKIKKYRKRLDRQKSELKKVRRARNMILNLIERETLTETQAEQKLNDLKHRESKLTEEMDRLAASLEKDPSPEHIQAAANKVARKFKRRFSSARLRIAMRKADTDFAAMTGDEKRALVEHVFDGIIVDGRPAGVYVETNAGQAARRRKRWDFTLHGHAAIDGLECVTQSVLHCTRAAPP